MARITNPHVALAHGLHGESGEAGKLPGCVHASDPDVGLTWQCVICELVTVYAWPAIDDHCDGYLKAYGDGVIDAVPLPPCPGCGAIACLNNSDVEYGLEMPHHYTRRALDEHLLKRPRLRGRFRVNAHLPHEKWQGKDFSHKPPSGRPPQHEKLGPEHTGL